MDLRNYDFKDFDPVDEFKLFGIDDKLSLEEKVMFVALALVVVGVLVLFNGVK
jgi:hypothetical protein